MEGWDSWDQLGLLEQIGAVRVKSSKPDRGRDPHHYVMANFSWFHVDR